MTWREVLPMEERLRFVRAHLSGQFLMTELCSEYGISRKTGYKWITRFEADGCNGLHNRSRAPLTHPLHTPADVCARLLAFRRVHPTWGPRKLISALEKRDEAVLRGRMPAASTLGDLLKEAGLVKPQRRRSRASSPGAPPIGDVDPNAIWISDYKGEFQTRDSKKCYPLTTTDAATRYLLCCEGLHSTRSELAIPVFQRLFEAVGLPKVIRTDNGAPFCSPAIGGISRLSIWWTQLGIIHQRIAPASPQENGRHERMHRTLKAETVYPPAKDLADQQLRFAAFVKEYNTIRPHEALGMDPPASRWRPPDKKMPVRLNPPEYDGHMVVRSVRNGGQIKFKGGLVFLSEVLIGHKIALEEIDDRIWSVYFYDRLLGRLDESLMKIIPLRSARAK